MRKAFVKSLRITLGMRLFLRTILGGRYKHLDGVHNVFQVRGSSEVEMEVGNQGDDEMNKRRLREKRELLWFDRFQL